MLCVYFLREFNYSREREREQTLLLYVYAFGGGIYTVILLENNEKTVMKFLSKSHKLKIITFSLFFFFFLYSKLREPFNQERVTNALTLQS